MTGNPTRIHSALINLTMNACDAMAGTDGKLLFKTAFVEFSASDKQLHPHAKTPASYLLISIIDNGRGMDKETVEKLHDNFYSSNLFGNGMGMGLSNTFACIRDMNGFIEIASIPDKGTTVEVYLPLQKNSVMAGETICGSCEILLIDNDDSVANNTNKMLIELGYSVVLIKDGSEAVEHLLLRHRNNQKEPDIVLLDMVLPELGGGECLKKVKEIYPSIKTILYTGYTLSEESETMINNGVNGFVFKPFDRSHLSQVIERVLSA
jgi:CheY-like chemotaxis protein